MSIQVIATGTLLTKPDPVDPDEVDVVGVMFGSRQLVTYRGQQVELDDVPTAEVVCTGPVAATALELDEGDQVEIRGELRILYPAEQFYYGNANGVIEIQAESITRTS